MFMEGTPTTIRHCRSIAAAHDRSMALNRQCRSDRAAIGGPRLALGARHLQAQHDSAALVQANQMETILAKIDADYGDAVRRLAGPSEWGLPARTQVFAIGSLARDQAAAPQRSRQRFSGVPSMFDSLRVKPHPT
jgi:hypothetical protein